MRTFSSRGTKKLNFRFMKHKNAGNLMYVKFRKHKNAGNLMKVPKAQKCLKFEDVYHHEVPKGWKLKDFKFTNYESVGNFRLKFPSDAQKCLKFVDFEAC